MKVYILLDRSGSMATLWDEALGAINGYVAKLGKKTKVHVAAFDSTDPYMVLRESTVTKFSPLTNEDAMPRGMTPLNDAAGKILDKMFAEKPKKAVLVIMTDGHENSSTEYNTAQIKAKIEMAKKKEWEVVFLGANFDQVETLASGYGVSGRRAMNISASNLAATMDCLSDATEQYAGTVGAAAAASFDAQFTVEAKLKAVQDGPQKTDQNRSKT